MTDVSQAIELTVTRDNFTRPREPYIGPIPFAQVEMVSSEPWDAVGSGDEQVVTMSGTLPSGYYYRCMDARILTRNIAETQMDNYDYGVRLFFSENGVQSPRHQHVLWNQAKRSAQTENLAGFDFNFSSVSVHNMSQWLTYDGDKLAANLIDGTKGVSMCTLTACCLTQSTTEMEQQTYIRLLAFTIEQAMAGVIYTSYPVY